MVYDAGWRTWVENKNARYTAVTVRYRRFTSKGVELSAGIGLFGGSYERTGLLRLPGGLERQFVDSVEGAGVAGDCSSATSSSATSASRWGWQPGGPGKRGTCNRSQSRCTAPGFLDTRLRYAAWRSSYSSRASRGVRYASFSRRQHWL